MSLIAIDFDNTLTADSGDPYKVGDETPNEEMVEYVRWLKEERNEEIVVWTARPWNHAGHIAGLLTMWGVPYNGLKCEKGGADVYVDDKAVNHLTDPDWKEGVFDVSETSKVH
ncbi:haloacid dehydrogenase superfamily protein [Halorubrum tailed virus 25]|uniref:Haloacid dehydrogenase superfamily protein n=1 Tax=Halorubrum tailed virus 25 TaxID=2878006 RepID=A0AAE8XXQ4_9CAUD|nr:phosphoheptose isomerase [Halorubrum tailed virus 25]UBF22637.1 haloacid dehydrogenase superfamily protein [Halorubrum tailed virus 25]